MLDHLSIVVSRDKTVESMTLLALIFSSWKTLSDDTTIRRGFEDKSISYMIHKNIMTVLTMCITHFVLLICSTVLLRADASQYHFHPSQQKPISLKSGLTKAITTKWQNANSLAVLEQAVEDYNAEEILALASDTASSVVYRRLIVLPLDERFDPPAGVFSHGHVQTGDKMSLPRNFWTAIQATNAEVPWLFEVSRVEGVTGARVVFPPGQEDPGIEQIFFSAPA